jgi:hypothetical protein
VSTKETNPKDLIGSRKAKLSVVPAGVLFEIGLGMLEGTVKYGRHNYRVAGVRSSVYYDAAIGHLMDFWEGEDVDPESGLSHLIKAIASLVVWRDAMLQGKLIDDRPPRSRVFKRHFNDSAAAIIDRHKDKSPRHYTINDIPKLDANPWPPGVHFPEPPAPTSIKAADPIIGKIIVGFGPNGPVYGNGASVSIGPDGVVHGPINPSYRAQILDNQEE